MIEEYRKDGFWIEPHLFCDEEIERLFMVAEYYRTEGAPPLIMPHRYARPFMEFMRSKQMVEVAAHLLGGPVSGLGTEFFFCAPGTKGFTPHQDNLYVQAPRGEFLHAWTAIDDVDASNGGLVFWRGSHRLPLLEPHATGEDSGEGQNAAARKHSITIPDDFYGEDIALKHGSTVFFDSHLIHASRENRSKRYRRSMLCTYILKGAPFNPGTKQKRVEIDLCTSSSQAGPAT